MPSPVRHPSITQALPAYEPEHDGIRAGWRLVIAALFALALAALTLHPVCRPDGAGADEWGFGVRHRQRGAGWLHCEPWVRHVFTD